MRDGVCSGCGAATVRAARNGIEFGDQPFTTIRPHIEPGFRGMLRLYRDGEVWQYVCVSCGRLEWHVQDQATLAFITEHWIEVPPAASS